MLRAVALICGALLLPTLASPTAQSLCPLGCNCTNAVVTCDTVEFPPLTQEFLELRIVRVKDPIVIDAEFFTSRKVLSLTNLYISESTIATIDPIAFKEANRLNSIHFVNCTLPELTPDTFLYATSLKLLNIDYCNLSKFVGLRSESLEQLKISFCQIKEITEEMFDTLDELTDLNLEGNKIAKIAPGSFRNLNFLADLNLANNNITELPRVIFDENSELVSVNLGGNPLQKIDATLFINLELLVLSNCQLREFRGNELDVVVNLDLSDNLLTKLSSDAFGDMINLEYLNLSKNRLTSLPTDIFANNSRLSRIILDRNDLQRLPKFKNSENFLTQSFSCNDCGLESLEPDVFQDMSALISLHLSNNRIQKLESNVFDILRNLRVLDISYNAIQDLDVDIFKYNTGLKKLNLAGNNIPYVDPQIFSHNKVIETLNVSNNGIEEIWKKGVANVVIPSLQVLNLADNRISKISVSDLEVVPNLKVLNLNNNDLDCTTEFKAAVRWLNMRTVIHSAAGLNAELNGDQMMTYTDTYWNDLYTTACDYEDSYNDDSEKDNYDELEMLKMLNGNWQTESDDGNEYFEQDIVVHHVYTGNRYSFVWPMLVFVITAVFVLFIVTNVILCVLRKRGQLPRNINLHWRNAAHNGFVYKPLTEDISRPRSIIIAHVDKPQTPNL